MMSEALRQARLGAGFAMVVLALLPGAAAAQMASPRPAPPYNASPSLSVPPLAAHGLRASVDRGITPAQALWNLRSAWNVAALDCPQPQYVELSDGYRRFLKTRARALKLDDAKVSAEWRAHYHARGSAKHDEYMTTVYNHFALPPTLPYFCEAVAAMSRDEAKMGKTSLTGFATRELPTIEAVFDEFYRQYDQYRRDAAAWDAAHSAPAAGQ